MMNIIGQMPSWPANEKTKIDQSLARNGVGGSSVQFALILTLIFNTLPSLRELSAYRYAVAFLVATNFGRLMFSLPVSTGRLPRPGPRWGLF